MAAPYVTTIDTALAGRMTHDLEAKGFEISKPEHTFFCAKNRGISCTLYLSGKLVVQGKAEAVKELVEFYLEPEIVGFEQVAPHIGSDEAGKGDFFGPLCIAGVFAEEEALRQLLKWRVADSKAISDGRVVRLASQIREACPHHIIVLRPQKYNELYSRFRNLNSLLAWAHAAIIKELHLKTGCAEALVDQFANERVLERALGDLPVSVTQRPRAEADPIVAAASILARAAFLQGLDALSKEVGITLPKGANSHIIDVGRRLVAQKGPEILHMVGKTHFKTSGEILC